MYRMSDGGKWYEKSKEGKKEECFGVGWGWGWFKWEAGEGLDGKAASEIRAKLVECVPGRGLQGQKPGEGRGAAGPHGTGPHGSR